MSLLLSTPDRAMMHRALYHLASPLEYPSISQWRAEVLKSLLPLFGADAAGFVLPHEGERAVTLHNAPERLLHDYVEHQMHDELVDEWKAQGFGAASIESLTRGERGRFTGGAMYSLVYSRHGVEDIIACVLDLSDKAPQIAPGKYFAPRGVPMRGLVAFLSSRPGTERFSAPGLELMWLLQPLLRAAGQTWKELAARRRAMVSLIDESSDGLLVYGPSGQLLHRNRALNRMLEDETQPAELLSAASRAAKSLARLLSRDGQSESADGAFERQVDTGAHRYTVRATRAETMLGRSGAILVVVKPLTRRAASPTQLVRKFGLTRREAEIAAMLAGGATNKQIVAALGFTEHTARRHTENVLRKLGLNSRAQVAGRVSGGHADT